MAKKNNNEVAEYLVKRIKELEEEKKTLLEDFDRNLLLRKKFDQIKNLFEYNGDGITKAIIVRDLKGSYVGILAIDSYEDFNEYLELLELNGKEEHK